MLLVRSYRMQGSIMGVIRGHSSRMCVIKGNSSNGR